MKAKDHYCRGILIVPILVFIAATMNIIALALTETPINADPIQAAYPNETKSAPTNVMYLEIDNKPVARLWYDGNVLKFEGNVDAGAKTFFEYVMRHIDFTCEDLCGPRTQDPVPGVH